MKAGKGKVKGGNFEREVCLKLSKWASNNPNQKEYIYYRSPSSGAMFTICKQQENLSGDIICVKSEYAGLTNRYSIECKTGYEKSSFNSIMKGNKDDFINFCKQCCDDASKANKLPLIIFKKKLHNILVAVKETDDINSFMEDIKCLTVRFDPVILLPSFKVYDMDEFFSKIEYDNLMECSYDDIRRSYNTISST